MMAHNWGLQPQAITLIGIDHCDQHGREDLAGIGLDVSPRARWYPRRLAQKASMDGPRSAI